MPNDGALRKGIDGVVRKSVTLRIDCELHQTAMAITKITGENFRDLVETGLRIVVDKSLKNSSALSRLSTEILAYKKEIRDENSV